MKFQGLIRSKFIRLLFSDSKVPRKDTKELIVVTRLRLIERSHEINQIILLALKLVSFILLSSPSSCLFVSFQINKKKKPVQLSSPPTFFSCKNTIITLLFLSLLASFFSIRSTPVRCQYTDVSPCSTSMAICRWNPHPNAYRGHS